MKEEIKYNLTNYLVTNKKKQILISIIMILILISIVFISFKYKLYSIEKVNATTICEENNCSLSFYLNKIEKENYKFVKIKEQNYKINSINFKTPSIDNTNSIFQEVTLDLKEYQGKNDEIVEIKLYKNKERLLKKIFNRIVER